MKKLNIAIIGQGRSGRQIHGVFYLSDKNTKFNVRYVVDKDDNRREKAKNTYPGCEVLKDYKELFDKKDIDLVVNASYSYQHYPISKDLLAHGFNVLCEKPFCRNEKECQDLIDTAKASGAKLAVFQQSFFAPFYQHAEEIYKSGILGDILQIDICYSGFSRRWDWQTLQKMLGGNSYNTGPHPYGVGMGLLGFPDDVKIIYSKLLNTEMSAGDYDDYVKVLITAPNKPLVDIEINNQDPYSPFNLKIMGTRGCYKTNIMSYEMKYLVPGENKELTPVETTLENENHDPIYCSEKLIAHEEKGNYPGTAFDIGTEKLYDDVYEMLVNGKELFITPERALKVTKLISDVHEANPIKQRF